MAWGDRMYAKYGHPVLGVDWIRKLAYFMGEAGNPSPSEEAIKVARIWETKSPESADLEEELPEDDWREDR